MDAKGLKEPETEYELSPAVPQKLPSSTYWPIILALGVIFFFWGFVTSLIITGVGFAAMGISLAGWIGELNNG